MSRFRFEIPTEAEAREFLAWRRQQRMHQDDLYQDTIVCQRRLQSVTSAAERDAVRRYLTPLEN